MKDFENLLLLCPRNDEESLMILKIAEKIGLATLVSDQPHGAKLSREKKLLTRIQKTNPQAEKIIIVEIPGPVEEKELTTRGYKVIVVDHHQYGELNRMKRKSSLEQFLTLLKISDADLKKMGFKPDMVAAVAALDRGFIWELRRLGYSGRRLKKALDFYRQLTLEVEGKRRLREEKLAALAWQQRTTIDGVLVVESKEDKISLRDPLSFLIAGEYKEPRQTIIVQGKRRAYVQDTNAASKLLKRFGGFTFGNNKCWGILSEDNSLPSVQEILSVIN